jgi:hypothetical protein
LARQASHRVPVPSYVSPLSLPLILLLILCDTPPKNRQPSLAPTYTLDVLSPLSSLLAPPGLSQVTPIALLKLENLYLPGTTIGVSGFIAYAMTRGSSSSSLSLSKKRKGKKMLMRSCD